MLANISLNISRGFLPLNEELFWEKDGDRSIYEHIVPEMIHKMGDGRYAAVSAINTCTEAEALLDTTACACNDNSNLPYTVSLAAGTPDCNDTDASIAITYVEDGDGDRIPCGLDCDDGDATITSLKTDDVDEDTITCKNDCDDNDPTITSLKTDDADADAVICEDDCDDTDPAVGVCAP